MSCYHSHITTNPWLKDLICELRHSDVWQLKTIQDPSFRFWVRSEAGHTSGTHISKPATTEEKTRLLERSQPAVEIIIEASSEDVADNVRNLIEAGILLAYPNVSDAPQMDCSWKVSGDSAWVMQDERFSQKYSFHNNALYGCHVANEAWEDSKAIYAIEKYQMSVRMDSFTPHSANPRYGQVFANERSDYRYHVHAGFAIVAAFAAIEELGLEIRSSAENPRFCDDEWNDDVHEDVSQRLVDAGVDFDDNFSWVMRGEPTSLHEEIWQHYRTLEDYPNNQEVRDVEMPIVEALHAVSVVRNYIFAHKFDEVASCVSPYDVHNAQSLARRLILSHLGLFKTRDPNITGLFNPSAQRSSM